MINGNYSEMHTVVDEIQYWDQVTVRHTPQVDVGINLFLCISEGSFEEVRAEIIGEKLWITCQFQ